MKWLLQRGHNVSLYEKSGKIGGHVRDAVAAPFKQDLRDYLNYMEAFAEHCGGRVLLNTEATPELLEAEHYDMIIAAIGADPVMLPIPGGDKPHVHWAPDAETGFVPCGENVVIVGGSSVGTEASINLAMQGRKVTVLELDKTVNLMDTGAASDLMEMSDRSGVTRCLGWKLTEILDDKVMAENVETGEKKEFRADTVLMAAGMKPRRAKALEFYKCCPPTGFFIIGDCTQSGDIRDAVWSAFEAVRYL
jgi:NADPH-dependent 2,4-dienoyl-CoA reductase/sulfur reductase-like enzyme